MTTDSSDSLYDQLVSERTKQIRKFGALPIFANRNRINIKRSLIGAAKFGFDYRNQDFLLMSRNDYNLSK